MNNAFDWNGVSEDELKKIKNNLQKKNQKKRKKSTI
jgi:hypothetical protein